MSYDEHLISMAGGDGETADQLAAIEARAQAAIVERESNFLDLRQFAPVIRAIDESSTDVPALLALVREQHAALALIANQVKAAEMLCQMNERDPELASVPAAAIRAVLTELNP